MLHEHIRIAVTDATTPGVEEVPARRVKNNDWQLVRSPLYATEVASGDIVRITNNDTGAFEIVARGGNVCIQFYLDESNADDAQTTIQAAEAIASEIAPLGGCMDGHTPGLIAFTIPASIGFPAIEEVFAAAANRYSGAQWQYANVYDPTTGEPLDWWR